MVDIFVGPKVAPVTIQFPEPDEVNPGESEEMYIADSTMCEVVREEGQLEQLEAEAGEYTEGNPEEADL